MAASSRKSPAKRARKPAAKPTPARRAASRTLGIFSAIAGGVALVAALVEGLRRLRAPGGHTAPDLALAQPRPGPDRRARPAFRPDPTAPVSRAEREALRPATVPVPTVIDLQAEKLEPAR